jgi:hypothetical protein
MKKIFVIIIFLFLGLGTEAQTKLGIMPYFHQYGLYYSSNHVTSAGYGLGAGLAVNYGNHLVAQTDMNICWLNGNALASRLAVGYKKSGKWSPAIFAHVSFIYGSHTEVLSDDGSRPVMPVTIAGLRIAPLRFENVKGFVSVIEYSFGLGRNNSRINELSLISMGLKL